MNSSAENLLPHPQYHGEPPKQKRQQFRSCDYCRKVHRACDAPSLGVGPVVQDMPTDPIDLTRPTACTTCARSGRACTFGWLRDLKTQNRNKDNGDGYNPSTHSLQQYESDDDSERVRQDALPDEWTSFGQSTLPAAQEEVNHHVYYQDTTTPTEDPILMMHPAVASFTEPNINSTPTDFHAPNIDGGDYFQLVTNLTEDDNLWQSQNPGTHGEGLQGFELEQDILWGSSSHQTDNLLDLITPDYLERGSTQLFADTVSDPKELSHLQSMDFFTPQYLEVIDRSDLIDEPVHSQSSTLQPRIEFSDGSRIQPPPKPQRRNLRAVCENCRNNQVAVSLSLNLLDLPVARSCSQLV
jgi:hypothetical protein